MKFDSDVKDPKYAGCTGRRDQGPSQNEQPDQAFLEDWLARTLRDGRQVPAAN